MTAVWRPSPGSRIAGEIISIGEASTEYGTYPIYTIRSVHGDKALHAYPVLLKRDLASRNVGDRVLVVYHGKRGSAKNKDRSYHHYEVADLVLPDDGEIPF